MEKALYAADFGTKVDEVDSTNDSPTQKAERNFELMQQDIKKNADDNEVSDNDADDVPPPREDELKITEEIGRASCRERV